MAEFLVKASEENIWYTRGVFVDERVDGFTWGKKETLPGFVIIKVPEIPLGSRRHLIKDKLYSDYEVITPILATTRLEIKEASGLPTIDKLAARIKASDFARDVLGVTNITAISADSIRFDKTTLAVKDVESEINDKLLEQLCMRYLFDTAIVADMVKNSEAAKTMTAIEFAAAIQDIMVI